jgi:hypothetical protein
MFFDISKNVSDFDCIEGDLATRNLAHKVMSHTTKTYPYVAPCHYAIIIKHKVVSDKYYDYIYALIIFHAKCI